MLNKLEQYIKKNTDKSDYQNYLDFFKANNIKTRKGGTYKTKFCLIVELEGNPLHCLFNNKTHNMDGRDRYK